MKLDRLLAKHRRMGRNEARRRILAGEVRVDGSVEKDHTREVDRFMRVECGGEMVAAAQRAIYIMLHKPAGIVSAVKDVEFPTVIDLIDDPDKHTLHIAGRLDRNTTGLVLLTNDGRWSKRLMHPDQKTPKVYLVETRDPIPPDAVEKFAAGFYFHTEGITTLPAELEITGERSARLTLCEGRYHQVKRMFHRIGNRVTALHRMSVGNITLPPDMELGEWRFINPAPASVAASL